MPTTTTTTIEGPKRLTIEDYRRRQAAKTEERLTRIPPTEKPKHRRGGRKVRLRRRLAHLLDILKSPTPPPYNDQRTTEMWKEVAVIRSELNTPGKNDNESKTIMN